MSRDSAAYFDAIDAIAGGTGHFYRITERDESRVVAVVAYDDVPESGHCTAFSYGLSSAEHSEWLNGRPELLISVGSTDHAWGLCMGEIIRANRDSMLFSQGTVLHFRQEVSAESKMTSFLVHVCTLLDGTDAKLSLPSREVNFSQLYPIHECEAAVIAQTGVDRFFWELGIDFYDVRRSPATLQ